MSLSNDTHRETQRATFHPGTVLGEVWEVDRKLGKGGMGSVYKCSNVHAPRIKAAIKLLDPAFQHHPEARARFLREAEILHRIDHPNVVNVSNVRLDTTPPFIEMDYVEGPSLETYLGKHGPPPLPEALVWAQGLANAVAYLHRRGIYHRDIKPDNILIRGADNTPVIVDFGLAVEASGKRLTQPTQTHFGTVSYCPPEWVQDDPLDPAAWDCYALGVVLFEMFTATVAFPISNDADQRRQMVQVIRRKQEVCCLDPGASVPPELRQLVRRLTMRDAADRQIDAQLTYKELTRIDPDWVPTLDAIKPLDFEAPVVEPTEPSPPQRQTTPRPRTPKPAPRPPSPWLWAGIGAVGAFLACSAITLALYLALYA